MRPKEWHVKEFVIVQANPKANFYVFRGIKDLDEAFMSLKDAKTWCKANSRGD